MPLVAAVTYNNHLQFLYATVSQDKILLNQKCFTDPKKCYWAAIHRASGTSPYKWVYNNALYNLESQGFEWESNDDPFRFPLHHCACLEFIEYRYVRTKTQDCNVTNDYFCEEPGKLIEYNLYPSKGFQDGLLSS